MKSKTFAATDGSSTVNAFTQRVEKRWWIFIWTPANQIVRILTSYPDKAAALRAIAILGYTNVPAPSEVAKGEPAT